MKQILLMIAVVTVVGCAEAKKKAQELKEPLTAEEKQFEEVKVGAEERAREILAQWNRGVSPALQQNPEELLRYERSRNLLSPFSIHIDEAVSEYANAKQVLGQVPLLEVARFYREFFPEKNEARQVSEVIEEYLEAKMEG